VEVTTDQAEGFRQLATFRKPLDFGADNSKVVVSTDKQERMVQNGYSQKVRQPRFWD
jgi:hypothetical protein